MDSLLLSREKFQETYENGEIIEDHHVKNRPILKDEEPNKDIFDFISEGSDLLDNENPQLIKKILVK